MRIPSRARVNDTEARDRHLLADLVTLVDRAGLAERLDDRGATSFEYLVALAAVALAVPLALRSLGATTPALFEAETQRLLAWQSSGASAGATRHGAPAPAGRAQPSPAGPLAAGTPQRAGTPLASGAPMAPGSTAQSGALYYGYDVPDVPIDEYAAGAIDWAKSVVRGASRRVAGAVYELGDRTPDRVKDAAFRGLELPPGAVRQASDFVDGQLDKLPDGVKERIPDSARDAYDDIRTRIGDVADVDFEAFRKTDGLNGDWYRFYDVWMRETSPRDLGQWDGDVVTITDPAYTGDLAGRPQHDAARALFFRKYGTDLSQIPPGATISTKFEYLAPDTKEGSTYGALESVIGSYRTTLTFRGIEPATGKAIFDVVVVNEARWASATRLPGSLQVGGVDHLIDDRPRDRDLGVGGDYFQHFVWTEREQPSTADVRVGKKKNGINCGAVSICEDASLESTCETAPQDADVDC